MNPTLIYETAVLGLATTAAAFDVRTGRIPNWLTVGALLVALPLHAWVTTTAAPDRSALEGMKWAVFGACACGLPMLLNWYMGWVGGGDFKLVAAMGALGGLSLGLESVFFALLCAISFVALRFAWNGQIADALQDTLGAVAERTSLRKHFEPRLPEQRRSLRFGPFALTGAALSFALHGGFT